MTASATSLDSSSANSGRVSSPQRRRCAAARAAGTAPRAPPRPPGSAPARRCRCAAGSGPATSRPGRACRRLLGDVGESLEAPAPEREDAALLAADDRDEGAVALAEQRDERRKQEVVGNARRVGDRRGQAQDAPDVVEPGREEREPVGAVAVELALEEPLHPLEVGLQAGSHLMRQVGTRGAVRLGRGVEQGTHAGRDVACGRGAAGIEIDVEADRDAVLRAEGRQLPQAV